MKGFILISTFVMLFLFHANGQFTQIVTSADRSFLLKQIEKPLLSSTVTKNGVPMDAIFINEKIQYQKMDGFGYTLTGGSAALLYQLPLQKRKAILNELFGQGPNDLQINFLRISMGASDLDATVFSYDDLPVGEEDMQLTKMSLANDQQFLIPLLKEIQKIQPRLKLIATPWSPPVWMKDNGKTMGGHLLPKFYDTYARYFVKYIQLMQKEGLDINAVTIQNEPEHGGNNPSMLMSAIEQTNFIKNHLGPAFKKEAIATEIVIWDHNADHPNYPIEILNDPIAKSFISASAFHLYLGDETALSKVHQAHPDKKIYFTEQWTGAKGNFAGDLMWHMEHIVIGTMANWSSMVLEWNLANDPQYGPHTPGGCTECLGALTVSGTNIQRNISYYIIGQVSKFIPAGSTRISAQSANPQIHAIAFTTLANKKVLLVLNQSKELVVTINFEQKKYNFTLPEKSVSTIVW
ncbi:MAG: glucosylceramidase [Sediminibacterium sp.]|nr:glucosylceramidase [Sediminibacterium sp.]MBP6144697.1 glucosylceramidase [Sediminibacterium sp.]